MNLKTGITVLGTVIALTLSATASADVPAPADGNRYYSLPRVYKSEVSVSEAYLAMEHSKDYRNASREPKPVLIDVRSLREYASGHPEDAYNVPYPTVSGLGGDAPQTPEKLYWEVYGIVHGNVDTPIMTLCRTGHRSVLAGNILADPDSYLQQKGLPAFTNVRNIWEGFVGQPKYAFRTGTDQLELDVNRDGVVDGPYQLDLNNDGVLNSDTADVYTQTKDVNPDKDGWRNFADLPWSTRMQKSLAYERDLGLYKALNLTPVQPARPSHHH
jgi:rhodanese-related sulfurtransferase